MDFDNPIVYGDTSIADGLVYNQIVTWTAFAILSMFLAFLMCNYYIFWPVLIIFD